MAEKPIICDTWEVQAILDGRKTQTRRVIKPQPELNIPLGFCTDSTDKKNVGQFGFGLCVDGGRIKYYKPRYCPGDILWVRETWCQLYALDGNDQAIEDTEKYYFAADGVNPTPFNHFPDENGCNGDRGCPRWKPSIYMHRVAARIFLRVTGVRVERVQDVSETDAKAEGVSWEQAMECGSEHFVPTYYNPDNSNPIPDYVAGYECLWNDLNAKRGYGWDTNPWVWVYEFESLGAQV